MRSGANALALLALLAVATWSRSAAAVKIRIKGSAHIEAVATAEQDGFTVRGELTDDVGIAIPSGAVTIAALAADGGKQPVALPAPLPCEAAHGRSSVTRPSAHEYVVAADERGTFCVRAATPLSGTLRLRYAGTKLHEPVEARVAIDTGSERLARTVLRFEPAPELIDLDRESVAITASLRIDRSESSRLLQNAPTRREGLLVVLEDERGARIGEAQTGGDGRVRFEVKTSRLGPPGPGELRLRFDASGALAKATATQAIVRRALVSMTVPQAPRATDPEAGIPIEVDVGSSRGPVGDGVIEALRNGESVGAGPVDKGRATVVVAFPAGRSGTVPLALRYVPSSPWWRAGAMLQVDVRVSGPGIAKHLLLAAVVAAFAAWIVAGWRRAPKKLLAGSLETGAPSPSGRAGVQVLGAEAGQSGWRGHVADAHDGTPIVGARLRIVVPSFDGDGVVAETTSDDRGSFALETTHRSDARLVVDSPDHSAYEQALPQPSVLGVALITRRRALLDRLVRWARRMGAPYDGPPEPTPGHVRRAAGRSESSEVEAWARRVEDAAFGPDGVDAALEDEVRAAEPRAR